MMEIDGEIGRRARKKQQTRDDLMTKAAELFDRNGFDATTTEDIAEAADVSQRTFFRHFASKEAVLYGDMDELRSRMREALVGRPDDEPILESLRRAILSLAESYEADRTQRLLQAKMAAANPSVSGYSRAVVQYAWEKDLIAALCERLGPDRRSHVRAEILAGAAMSALRAAIRQWVASDGVAHLPSLVDEALAEISRITAVD